LDQGKLPPVMFISRAPRVPNHRSKGLPQSLRLDTKVGDSMHVVDVPDRGACIEGAWHMLGSLLENHW
jgi:hypothetical protein